MPEPCPIGAKSMFKTRKRKLSDMQMIANKEIRRPKLEVILFQHPLRKIAEYDG